MLDEDQFFAKCEAAIQAMAEAGLAVLPDLHERDMLLGAAVVGDPKDPAVYAIMHRLEASGIRVIPLDLSGDPSEPS